MEIKALVADSSAKARKNIIRSLKEIGVRKVAEAADGDEAIQLLEKGTYDVVFAEWNTQVNSGEELVKALRKVNPKLPIIVTAPYMTEDQAITTEVMDRIASDPGISGRVGVDTFNNTVTLSGRVATPWQADKAQRHAQNTPGVREVNNELRARIGG